MVFNILSPTCFVRIVDKKLKGVLLLNSYQSGSRTLNIRKNANGSRYVAYKIDGVWQITHVNSDYEANNFISARTGQDYGFILLDD